MRPRALQCHVATAIIMGFFLLATQPGVVESCYGGQQVAPSLTYPFKDYSDYTAIVDANGTEIGHLGMTSEQCSYFIRPPADKRVVLEFTGIDICAGTEKLNIYANGIWTSAYTEIDGVYAGKVWAAPNAGNVEITYRGNICRYGFKLQVLFQRADCGDGYEDIGSGNCSACGLGRYRNSSSIAACEVCEAGFANTTASSACLSCPAGRATYGLLASDHDHESDCAYSKTYFGVPGANWALSDAMATCEGEGAQLASIRSADEEASALVALNETAFDDANGQPSLLWIGLALSKTELQWANGDSLGHYSKVDFNTLKFGFADFAYFALGKPNTLGWMNLNINSEMPWMPWPGFGSPVGSLCQIITPANCGGQDIIDTYAGAWLSMTSTLGVYSCANLTTCDAQQQYEVSAARKFKDRVCGNLTICGEQERNE